MTNVTQHPGVPYQALGTYENKQRKRMNWKNKKEVEKGGSSAVKWGYEKLVWTKTEIIAFVVLLVGTGAAYLYHLSANGYANSFYAAAAQAGSKSWEAFLWGSLDASNSITVDKPPLSLWLPSLAVRIFGLSSWSILVPEVLIGLATMAVMYCSVRTSFGRIAAWMSAFLLAVTPIAALMFRFNNPDALLMLLEVSAIAAAVKATRTGKGKWLFWSGVFLGLGFLTKQLQVMLVAPGIALAYLIGAPRPFWKRLLQGLWGILGFVIAAGWWVLLTVVVPASMRPYIGGSQNNSFIELTFGYNGFGRLTGNEVGSVGGGGGTNGGASEAIRSVYGSISQAGGQAMHNAGNAMMGGSAGLGRLLTSTYASQWAYFSATALLGLIAGLFLLGRNRHNTQRTHLIAWGSWFLVTFGVFSYMQGIFHQYYTIALVPPIAVLTAIGTSMVWRALTRTYDWHRIFAGIILPLIPASAAGMSYYIAGMYTSYHPWIRTAVLVTGILSVLLTIGVSIMFIKRPENSPRWSPTKRGVATAAVAVALFAGLAVPVAYSANTLSTGHSGSIVTAGPGGNGGMGGGMGGGDGMPGNFGNRGTTTGTTTGQTGTTTGQTGTTQTGTTTTGQNGMTPPGGTTGTTTGNSGMGQPPTGAQGTTGNTGTTTTGQMQTTSKNGAQAGGMNGLLNGASVSTATKTALEKNSSSYKWVAATIGSQNAASYQLATELPVMAIGGFNGSDPSPTLAQFKQYVANGEIHYFIASGSFGGQNGGSNVGSQITSWVESNFKKVTVGNTTMYDLTQKA